MKETKKESEIITLVDERTEPLFYDTDSIRFTYVRWRNASSMKERNSAGIELLDECFSVFDKNQVPSSWTKQREHIARLQRLGGGSRTYNRITERGMQNEISDLWGKIKVKFRKSSLISFENVKIETKVMAKDGKPEGVAPAPKKFDLIESARTMSFGNLTKKNKVLGEVEEEKEGEEKQKKEVGGRK